MKDLRVVFMGTPEFAVPSLRMLVENGIDVVGVITAPDKPQGRGKKMGTSAVKDYAISAGLNILQPTNLKSEDFLKQLKALNGNLQVVVAFRMLPESVWQLPDLGTFNLHASLLPHYRGAAPINWAIINGEKTTGVTTFYLKHEIDTGNIILQESEPIYPDDNAGTLYERLKNKGADLVLKTVQSIADGTAETQQQIEPEALKGAPKIFKQTCQIDWNNSNIDVYNFIRGLSPYPGAWTTINNKQVKIFQSRTDQEDAQAGSVDSDNKTYLRIGCNSGSINVIELQMEGKKRMKITDFLKGYRI